MVEKTNLGSFDFEEFNAQIASEQKDSVVGLLEQQSYSNVYDNSAFGPTTPLVSEFDPEDEKRFLKAIRTILLSRNLRKKKSVAARSSRRMKKAMQHAIAIGEVSQYFQEKVLGYSQRPIGAYADELFQEASKYYIKDHTRFKNKIKLSNKTSSPVVEFIKINYCDKIGNDLPLVNWGLIVVDGLKVKELPLLLSSGSGDFDYFEELAIRVADGQYLENYCWDVSQYDGKA